MATRGWQDVTMAEITKMAKRGAELTKNTPARSKYRNVKTVVNGIRFDSKREADYYTLLRARVSLGEISDLQVQQEFELMCPAVGCASHHVVVALYVADFTYLDSDGTMHVVDAKGHRTQTYKLKKKWLELQDGIVIEEV